MRSMLLVVLPMLAAACVTERVEEPAYLLQLSDGSFQVRSYGPSIVAETSVDGDAMSSRFEGFGPLADYIFAKERPGAKIAMTAPVTQQEDEVGRWTVAFTMPANYALDDLPSPASERVRLVEQPSRVMAVMSFSGVATDRGMDEARAALLDKIRANGLTAKGDPVFAFYDPPWTPSFMRRNEVMIEVARAE